MSNDTKLKLAPPVSLFERLPEEWAELFLEWGEPRYRAKQVFQWIHKMGVADPDLMTNLPKTLRDKLKDAGLAPPGDVADTQEAEDGTRKLLVRLIDGKDTETVLIPQSRGSDDNDDDQNGDDWDSDDEESQIPASLASPEVAKFTQCISSQVGCAMACGFCASGLAGLKRNMNAGEIVYQVILAQKLLEAKPNNLVFMGMGEPLHNYDALLRALVLLTHPEGLHFSRRRITVSTSGLIPQIAQLGRDFGGRIRLAVSIHATSDETRTELMPINKKYPLASLIRALHAYPMPPRDRMTIEYTLVRDKNDSIRDADALAKMLKNLKVKINVIPMNPVPGVDMQPPPWDRIEAFQNRLREHKLSVFLRKRKGDEIAAACGQLALHGERPRRKGFALPQVV